jgi:hypothetical protein
VGNLMINVEPGQWITFDLGDGSSPVRLQATIRRSGSEGGKGEVRLRIDAPRSIKVDREDGMRPRLWAGDRS